nr:hypothetical protein CFP56_31829 [Quercus suber]
MGNNVLIEVADCASTGSGTISQSAPVDAKARRTKREGTHSLATLINYTASSHKDGRSREWVYERSPLVLVIPPTKPIVLLPLSSCTVSTPLGYDSVICRSLYSTASNMVSELLQSTVAFVSLMIVSPPLCTGLFTNVQLWITDTDLRLDEQSTF